MYRKIAKQITDKKWVLPTHLINYLLTGEFMKDTELLELKHDFINKPNNEVTVVEWLLNFLKGKFIAVKDTEANGDRHELYFKILDIYEPVNDDFALQLISGLITDLITRFNQKFEYEPPKQEGELEPVYEELEKEYKANIAKRKSKHKFLISCNNHSKLIAIFKLIKTRKEINRTPKDIEVPANILPLQNGIFDLDKKTFRNYSDTDIITYKIPIYFHQEMTECPRFMGLLKDWTNGDKEYIDYIQEFLGFLLSGKTSERHFWFVYGPGGTGKSTFLGIVARLLGNFFITAPKGFLLESFGKEDRKIFPSLENKRAIIINEIGFQSKWDSEGIKSWTGDPQVSERVLYTNSAKKIKPTGKLIFCGNGKPDASSFDCGLFERIEILPFTNVISKEKRLQCKSTDTEVFINDLIETEGSAILNWAIEGYKVYEQRRLYTTPRILNEAKSEYQNEVDVIAEWVESNTKEGYASFRQLYNDYCEWCKRNNRYCISPKKANEYFSSKWGKPKRIRINGELSKAAMYGVGLRIANVNESFGKFNDID